MHILLIKQCPHSPPPVWPHSSRFFPVQWPVPRQWGCLSRQRTNVEIKTLRLYYSSLGGQKQYNFLDKERKTTKGQNLHAVLDSFLRCSWIRTIHSSLKSGQYNFSIWENALNKTLHRSEAMPHSESGDGSKYGTLSFFQVFSNIYCHHSLRKTKRSSACQHFPPEWFV